MFLSFDWGQFVYEFALFDCAHAQAKFRDTLILIPAMQMPRTA